EGSRREPVARELQLRRLGGADAASQRPKKGMEVIATDYPRQKSLALHVRAYLQTRAFLLRAQLVDFLNRFPQGGARGVPAIVRAREMRIDECLASAERRERTLLRCVHVPSSLRTR